MSRSRSASLVLTLVFASGCSTLDNPTIISGLAGFATCSVVGAISAPSDERPEMHAALWGAACSSAAMMTSEILTADESKRTTKASLQKMRSEDSLQELRIKNSILNSKGYENLDFETKEKLKGDWTVYKIDNWILDRGKVKHEDMEIEFE